MYVSAYAPLGVEGIIIRVEADIRRGIPGVDITGLAEGAVREARDRVRAAFRNSGFAFPQDRVLINLAPAGVRKDGAGLDLPIALAVMAAAGLAPSTEDLMVLGELELSGKLRPVRGVLAATAAGLKAGIRGFIVPLENAAEAAILAGDCFSAAATLGDAAHILVMREHSGKLPVSFERQDADDAPDLVAANGSRSSSVISGGLAADDFSDVRGQGRYKRALEIAAAGAHNLLVFGPPGAGKTMLARRLPSIMMPLTAGEAVDVTRLYSLAGQMQDCNALISGPPFRSPHHSASAEGILGGGKLVKPGEISLAHLGVLFLDEAPEFRSNVLQALREPLEDRVITISRAEGSIRLPADFQLIMAANSCPCGRLGAYGGSDSRNGNGLMYGNEPGHGGEKTYFGTAACLCAPDEIYRYWRKFGAALLDRIELRVPVQAKGLLPGSDCEEKSRSIAERVRRAAEVQESRLKSLCGPEGGAEEIWQKRRRNSRIPASQISRFCRLDEAGEAAFRDAVDRLGLSGRACHGILRVGRTIADLEGSERIMAEQILEAVEHHRLGDDPYDILSF